MLVLLLGGARSGKSDLAVRMASASGLRVVMIATAEAGDEEMATRIERHRAERPSDWETVEATVELAVAIGGLPPDPCVIIDDLTLWVANLLADHDEDAIRSLAVAAARLAAARSGLTVVVSNEVGLGIVPDNALARRYRDALGRVNAVWAEAADEAYVLLAGRPVPLAVADDLVARHAAADGRDGEAAARKDKTGSGPPGRPLADEARGLLAAASFLTRVPLAGSTALGAEDVRRAGLSFPLVGAVLGAGVGALADRLSARGPAVLGAALAVAAGTLVTGALHLDALADTTDALGTHSRERALEVMRDSTIGAFGASAIGLDLAIRIAAVAALTRGRGALRPAIVAGALSRSAPVALAAVLPYARHGEGTGVALTGASRGRAVGAVALAAGITAGVAPAGDRGTSRRSSDRVRLVGVAVAVTVAMGRRYRRWLGGVTGDALGAAVELTETAVLVAAALSGEVAA